MKLFILYIVILNYCRGFDGLNIQPASDKIKFLKEYERITQKVLFSKSVLDALMSGRKYEAIHQNGDCSRKNNVCTSVFRNKSPLSKRRVVTKLNMKMIHLQIMLPDVV
jgi:hypothetical protein